MADDLDRLIADTRVAMDEAMASVPNSAPRGWVNYVREVFDWRRKIAATPDEQLTPNELVVKRQELAEQKRWDEKWGPEFERAFNTPTK